MTQTIVGVLRGGPSSEYEVSLSSGSEVLKHLPEGYVPIDIFISKQGEWHVDGHVVQPQDILKKVDVVFNALHGEYGEDGKVQGILEREEVSYTGSTSLASAVGMNKAMTKKILKVHDVRMPIHMVLHKNDLCSEKVREVFHTFPQPSVIKPLFGGSSVGVRVARTEKDLTDALEQAFTYADKVIVEEYIQGKEATCGIVEGFRGEENYTLMPTEIVDTSGTDVWGYDSKYSDDMHSMYCPGRFFDSEKKEIQRLTKLAHEVLGLRHYSRSDFIVHPKRGVYFLEVNTLPGLTEASLLSHALVQSGSDLSEFLGHILERAMLKV